MKDKKLLFSILLVFVFLLSIGLTYAYFSLDVFGNDNANIVETSTGRLELTYDGGPTILADDIFPGWTSTKTFTVTNTGSLNTDYSINWENINNSIIRNELKMSLTCTGTGCKTLSQVSVGNTNGPFLDGISIAPGVTHTYQLTISFIETGSEQNYNQGKGFSGTIIISDAFIFFDMYGTLVNASDAPIAGATLTLMSEPKTVVTDENGYFMFENVEADNHTITASVGGEELLSDSLTISDGERTEIEDTSITRRTKTSQVNVKIKANADKSISSIDQVHNTLSPNWATILGITKKNIISILVETSIESPATYTFNGTTYDRSRNGIDVSENTNGSVLASTYTDGTNEVIVMINSRGMTSLPEDSSYIFSVPDYDYSNTFRNLEFIQTENIDTSQVINMVDMFYGLGNYEVPLRIDIRNWDTSQVTNMSGLLCQTVMNSDMLNMNLSNLDTSQVTNMYGMFKSLNVPDETVNLDLSNWDTSRVTDMRYMFSYTSMGINALKLNMSIWDTSNVTNMDGLFYESNWELKSFELDLSNWDTSKVISMANMFNNAAPYAKTWAIGDLSNWDTSQVMNMSALFFGPGRRATVWDIGDLSNWDTSKVTNMMGMFHDTGGNAVTWDIGDLSDWNTSQVTDMSWMFNSAGSYAEVWNIGDISNWDTSKVTNMNGMFEYAGSESTTINLDLSNWDTSKVINMSEMFCGFGKNVITSTLNIRGFNLSSLNTTLTSYDSIFYNMNANAQITVGSSVSKDWILNLTSPSNRPAWTNSNIIVDERIPTNNSVAIDSGATQNRILTLSSTNANMMCISNTSSVPANCTNWERYRTSKLWTFPKTIGTHTVYVFYRMGTGTPSTAASESATVTSIPPVYLNETFSDTTYDSSIAVIAGATYPWAVSGGKFKSTNQGQNETTSSSTISFTPTRASFLTFTYGISSENYNDELTITLTGSDLSKRIIVYEIDGEVTGTVKEPLTAGVTYTLELFYTKNYSTSSGSDTAYIDNLLID